MNRTLAGIIQTGVLLTLLSTPARSQWTGTGAPLCSDTTGQSSPLIVPDGTGGAIATWTDDRGIAANGGTDIYAQHILADGSLAWDRRGVPICTAAGAQVLQSVVTDGAGGAIILWSDKRAGSLPLLYTQHIGLNGVAQWSVDGIPISSLPFMLGFGVEDGAGGVFVVWSEGDVNSSSSGDIYGQRIISTGSVASGWPPDGLPICTAPQRQVCGVPVSDGTGGWIVSWADHRAGFGWDIYASRATADGVISPGWTVDGVAICTAPYNQVNPVTVSDGAGGAVIAWDDQRIQCGFSCDDVYAQHLLANGTRDASWAAQGDSICAFAETQDLLSATSDGAGGLIAFWADHRVGDWPLYAGRITSAGTRPPGWPVGGIKIVPVSWASTFTLGQLGTMPDGSGGAFFAGYYAGVPLVGRITSSGAVAAGWPPNGTAVSTQSVYGAPPAPSLCADGAGGVIVGWQLMSPNRPSLAYASRVTGAGVVPTLVSLVRADAGPGSVRITWSGGAGTAARIWRRTPVSAWVLRAESRFDSQGRLSLEDREVAPSARYGYRLGLIAPDGSETAGGEVWVDVPATPALTIEGLLPNPAARDAQVAFTLADNSPATLELFDAGGRRVLVHLLTALGAGQHVIALAPERVLAPGLHFLRLTQGGHVVTRRAVLLR